MNQCDGCLSGDPIVGGMHINDNGLPYMVCQIDKYGAVARVYSVGDDVEVELPGGTYAGKVREAGIYNSWDGVQKYRVDGDGFETITSAKWMRPSRRNED